MTTTQKVRKVLAKYDYEVLMYMAEQLFSHIYPGPFYDATEDEQEVIIQDLVEILDTINDNIAIIRNAGGGINGAWGSNTEEIE